MFNTYTDKFVKENFIYTAFWFCWTIFLIFIGAFITVDCYNKGVFNVTTSTLFLLSILILACYGPYNIINCLKLPLLNVDTDKLQFTYAGITYNFDSLVPSYDVRTSVCFMMFDFTLYFKNGTSLQMKLPWQAGLSFAEKYLNKYSKPNSSLYFRV